MLSDMAEVAANANGGLLQWSFGEVTWFPVYKVCWQQCTSIIFGTGMNVTIQEAHHGPHRRSLTGAATVFP